MTEARVYCGYDSREQVGFHGFVSSMIRRSSKTLEIIPLNSRGLPEGSNSFTRSRFLVPYLCGFKGRAIFADASDMLCLGDIAELDALYDPAYAVQVVKHQSYESIHRRKYIGTEMECAQTNYPMKNWASCMIINAGHRAWAGMTPERISAMTPMELLQFQHFDPDEIGSLPKEWNVLVDEGQEMTGAKILHWTAGLPSFRHYRNAKGSAQWFDEFEVMTGGMQSA